MEQKRSEGDEKTEPIEIPNTANGIEMKPLCSITRKILYNGRIVASFDSRPIVLLCAYCGWLFHNLIRCQWPGYSEWDFFFATCSMCVRLAVIYSCHYDIELSLVYDASYTIHLIAVPLFLPIGR